MHYNTYNPNDVLADTIETCPPCHKKIEWEGYVKAPKGKMIKLEPHVHKALHDIGVKDESYSQIIERLIKFYKEHQDG